MSTLAMCNVIVVGFQLAFILTLSLICDSLSHQTVQVVIGQTASLPCTVEITGSINVEWISPEEMTLTYDREVLTPDKRFSIQQPYIKEWILVISNVRTGDAGNYTCRAGPLPEINRYVELIVTIPPEIIKTSGARSYLFNSTVTLTCDAKGTPEPKITWHRMNEHHTEVALSTEGNRYVIDALNLSTAGVYECRASNGVFPVAMTALVVDVLFSPIVKMPYQEVTQVAGKWTQLSCLVAANPSSEILWVRNGQRIKNSDSTAIIVEEFGRYGVIARLSIAQLSYSDFGTYECYAENKYGNDTGCLSLSGEQRQKAVVISKPRDVVAAVGEDVVFNCSVLHLPEGDYLIWWHRTANDTKKLFQSPSGVQNLKKTHEISRNIVQSAKHDIIGQYNLLIRRTNFSDAGIYICQMDGYENFSATLDVIATHDPSARCQDVKQTQVDINMMLIILAVVVIVLLVVAVVVIVLVCRFLTQRSHNWIFCVQKRRRILPSCPTQFKS